MVLDMDTTRRKVMLWAAATVLLLGAIFYAVLRPARTLEPSYGGKTLCEWLESGDLMAKMVQNGATTVRDEATAVREIGTNAIPYLLEWIASPPPWKFKLDKFTNRFFGRPLFGRRLLLDSWRADNAVWAFIVLGPKASAAIPDLTRMINTSNVKTFGISLRSFTALQGIGMTTLPSLMAMMTNRQEKARDAAICIVGSMDANAFPAVPSLIQCLADKDEKVVKGAIRALGTLHLQPDLVVPALTNYLVHPQPNFRSDTEFALQQFGPAARPAVPLLKRLLTDSDAAVRYSATNALRKIAPEALTNVPTR
jgi:hypothetical protein